MQNNTSSPTPVSDLIGHSYDLQKDARLYSILATPPTFDLSRGYRREYAGKRGRIVTSTPARVGKGHRFFGGRRVGR
jgi:hypothetical protein